MALIKKSIMPKTAPAAAAVAPPPAPAAAAVVKKVAAPAPAGAAPAPVAPVKKVVTSPKATVVVATKMPEQEAEVVYEESTSPEELTQEGPGSSEPMATVHFSMGVTKSLGDYEFVRVDVGVTIPCEATEEALEETYEAGKEWVDAKLNAVIEEIEAPAAE